MASAHLVCGAAQGLTECWRGQSSWPPGSCPIIVQRIRICCCLNAPFCSPPSETRCRKTPAAVRLAAESERIGLVDYISVFIQQQRETENEHEREREGKKKFCLVQYPALALTKVWKFRAAHTHTHQSQCLSSSFHLLLFLTPKQTAITARLGRHWKTQAGV